MLVGRAKHQAGALSAELRKLGATVIEIPFIEIRKPQSFKPLDAALRRLNSYDWLILTSVNGVDAMWERMAKAVFDGPPLPRKTREGNEPSRAATRNNRLTDLAAEVTLRIAAIGPATKKAIEQRGVKVDVVPSEYVAESVVRTLRRRVKGKRVLLVRAKVARDVIPVELRKAGAHVDVVEAYETVVPESSRTRLRALLKNPKQRPHVVTFTSSSTVRNFVALVAEKTKLARSELARTKFEGSKFGETKFGGRRFVAGIKFASIGPVTSSTLREAGLPVDISAKEFTIPGIVAAIAGAINRAE